MPPHRLETEGSPMEEDNEPPLAKSPPHMAQAGDSDSASYVLSEADRGSPEAPRRGRVRRRPLADGDDNLERF